MNKARATRKNGGDGSSEIIKKCQKFKSLFLWKKRWTLQTQKEKLYLGGGPNSEIWKGMVGGHCRDEQFEEVSSWTRDFRTLCKRTREPEREIKERRDEKNNKGELKHVLKMASMQMRWRERPGCFWKRDRREMREIRHRGEHFLLWTAKSKLGGVCAGLGVIFVFQNGWQETNTGVM